ncbi:MAG: hypothetical protein A2145_03475 [candidate division Zixibacteria bacterium RBG_16_40_9]|nr:MAG: hypothetical protein A2145_03475 [candidate division Zixibacteria bacterium RBG_16_40_9]
MSEVSVKWVVHPLKKNKKKTFLLVLILIVVWGSVYWYTLSLGYLLLAIFILVASLSAYFFPTVYELTKEKVTVKYVATRKEKTWDFFRSFYADKNGVFLSPFPKPSRLENFRGLYLRYNDNKEEVLNFVREHIKTE